MNASIITARHTSECQTDLARQMGFVFPEANLQHGEQRGDTSLHACICGVGMNPESFKAGAPATLILFSDRYALTVVEGSTEKRVGVRMDTQDYRWVDGYGSNQEWTTEPNPAAEVEWFSARKSGRWVRVGAPDDAGEVTISLGHRSPYRDPTM